MIKHSQKSITARVERTISENSLIFPNEKIVVAVSGGPDSTALLNILLGLKNKLKIDILACHYNHRLRGEASEKDQQFVQKFCQERGIELLLGTSPEKNKYKNEDEAREARYAFFKNILEEGRGDKIALAHNLNDLAETTLQRIVRGSGLRGLSSIPISRGKFIRPLLFVKRKEIEAYISSHNIGFCLDQTNFDKKFLRNRIRLETLPHLESINPNILESLLSLSQSAKSDYSYLEAKATEALSIISQKRSDNSITIVRSKWLELDEAMRTMTLRLAIEKVSGLNDISYKQIGEVLDLIDKGEGRKKKILPHSLQIELEAGKIVLSKLD
ncbi:MAG: tRNA lysidine(34) synthetase TilS [Patescibacteria group bacterium]|jgi:tRNA(Ile)-lysidine synthase